ncbi:MAG: YggT family protein [Nitrospinota bacterium]
MFVFSNMVHALASVVNMVLTLYLWIIIGRAVLSWVNPDPNSPVVQFLYRVTEPVLEPIRRALPMHSVGIDISPLVVIFGIYFLQMFLVPTLQQFALAIR